MRFFQVLQAASRGAALVGALALFIPGVAAAAAGREGAGFLEIPVGAEPAALGSAYTALAENAYATVWNPAGLALVDVTQIAGMHLSYLESISYEHLSGAIPLPSENDDAKALGFSIQSLSSGDIQRRDVTGTVTGSFSTTFGAYGVGYGQKIGDHSALGLMGKAIREKISDASATAYAADVGWLYFAAPNFTWGAAFSNVGPAIRLVDQSDPLPFQGRLGAAWRIDPDFRLSSDLIYRRNGPAAGALGLEWSNSTYFALRGGYNSSHIKELGPIAGMTAGGALRFWGQEFAYAWVPFGDLGSTHYFSLLIRFTTDPRPDRAYPNLPKTRLRQAKNDDDFSTLDSPAQGYHDYGNIDEMLSDSDRRALKKLKGNDF